MHLMYGKFNRAHKYTIRTARMLFRFNHKKIQPIFVLLRRYSVVVYHTTHEEDIIQHTHATRVDKKS